MLPGQELAVFVGQRVSALKRHGRRPGHQAGKVVAEHVCATPQHDRTPRPALVFDAERVPVATHEVGQRDGAVVGAQSGDQLGAAPGGMRVHLEQPVASALELGVQARRQRGRVCDQRSGPRGFGQRGVQCIGQRRVHRARRRADRLEAAEPVAIPAQQYLARGTFEIRHVQFDGGALTDAIEAPDALLEQIGLAWQVEQHEVVGELEVAALTADLRADQHL